MKHFKSALVLLLCALLALGCTACSAEDVSNVLDLVGSFLDDPDPYADDASGTEQSADDASASAEADSDPDAAASASTTTETSGSGSQSATVLPSPDNWLDGEELDEDGTYSSQEDVAAYLVTYKRLPDNYITKKQAEKLGWHGGSLEPYAPGKCIGGSRFGNYEGRLPEDEVYYECDIDTLGAKKRGAERLVYCEDFEHIYYTSDHYESFTLIYSAD